MSSRNDPGMSTGTALRIEFGIIGLGVLALIMIFQPFSLTVFSIGCGLVVLAALANNLLPMAQPGKPLRGVILAALIVALTFSVVVLLSIAAAHLYGVAFLNPPAQAASPVPLGPPFWMTPFVWGLAAAAVVFALLLRAVVRRK